MPQYLGSERSTNPLVLGLVQSQTEVTIEFTGKNVKKKHRVDTSLAFICKAKIKIKGLSIDLHALHFF